MANKALRCICSSYGKWGLKTYMFPIVYMVDTVTSWNHPDSLNRLQLHGMTTFTSCSVVVYRAWADLNGHVLEIVLVRHVKCLINLSSHFALQITFTMIMLSNWLCQWFTWHFSSVQCVHQTLIISQNLTSTHQANMVS